MYKRQGYGEMLFSKAFEIPCHTVETVAHARASEKYVKDASFILDIGGQDMKAIWLEDGVITNILDVYKRQAHHTTTAAATESTPSGDSVEEE